jgi:hypothetical protein
VAGSHRFGWGWVCGLLLLLAGARPTLALGPHGVTPGLEDAVRHLCVEVLQGQAPDPARIAPLLEHVRHHGDASLGLPKFEGAPGAYQGFAIRMPMQRLLRYLYNPAIPQEIVKPFSIRSSVWTTPGSAEAQRRLWADPWPPQETVVIRGEQFDRTTPDPSTGGGYAMRLQRAIVFIPEGRAVLSVSAQPEPSEVGVKGYALGRDHDGRYVYSGEQGLTRAGLGWVSSRIQTNVSIGVYVQESDESVRSGVFQWMRAGWSGLSVVKESHVAASLVRYRSLLSDWVASGPPKPQRLEALFAEAERMSDDELRARAGNVLGQWRALAAREDVRAAERILADGYEGKLDRGELVALYMRGALEGPD